MTDTSLNYFTMSAHQPWSLTSPDSSTLRFELRAGDHYVDDPSSSQRSEISPIGSDGHFYMYPSNTPIEVTYDFKIEAGTPTTANFVTLGQFHDTTSGVPPYFVQLRPGDHMHITIKNSQFIDDVYADPNPLVRDHTYHMKIDVNFSTTDAGYLQVWRDGVQIVDYHGPIGLGDSVYWKEGVYRSTASETMAVDYSNLKIVTPTETDVLALPGAADPTPSDPGTTPVDPTHTDTGTGTSTGDTGTGTGTSAGGTGTGTGTGTSTGDTGTGTGTNAGGTGTGTGTGTSTGDTGTGTGTNAGGTGTGTGTSAGDTGTGTGTGDGTGTSTGDTGTGTGTGTGTSTGDTGAGTGTGTGDTNPPPLTDPPPADLMLRGGGGSDHLTGGDGNDQLYGAGGNDVLIGNSGNDVLSGGDGRDILMGGQGNDNIDGGSGKDYLLLDGSMQDYTIAVTRRGVTITDSSGDVDTVKNVQVFHFSDGTNYLVGRHGLVQTGDQTINTFLAASGVDQSLLGSVSTAQAQQAPAQSANQAFTASNSTVTSATVGSADPHPSTPGTTAPTSPGTIPPITQQHNGPFGGFATSDQFTTFSQALNQAGHGQGVDKVLTNAALWNAVDASSNSPTHVDTVLADLKQQLHDTFDHNLGTNNTMDELAAMLHLTHHE